MHGHIQSTDIHAKLQSICCSNSEKVPIEEGLLNLTTLLKSAISFKNAVEDTLNATHRCGTHKRLKR